MGLTQMMQHYLKIKEAHKDCVLFYRLGDFYEMFFDDAVKVSKLLDLTLTGKDCGLSERAPMCGIPFHAADTYIEKLVACGEKIAICEQVSDPKAKSKAGDLVEREVIKIVSAGTLTEVNMLDEKKNNFIAALYKEELLCAVSWADITTGELFATSFEGADGLKQALDHLVKIAPSELLCNDEALFLCRDSDEVRHNLLPRFSSYFAWAFNLKHAENNLLEQFHTVSLAAYGINACPQAVSAAGALLEYLKETQKHALKNISDIKYIRNEKYMSLDNVAVRNLELLKSNAEGKKYGSLLWLLDRTATGMGGRMLSGMILSPLKDKEEIEYRLNGVEELVNGTVVRMSLAELLKEIRDIERLAGKISNGNLTPKDCLSICESLQVLPSVKFQLSGFSSPILRDIDGGIDENKPLANLLERAIDPNASTQVKDGKYIRVGYNKELDELRILLEDSDELLHQIEEEEREATGIPKLKIAYNRVFGFYIEVSNSFKDKVPDRYIRRQTLTTGERFITPELKALEDKIINAKEDSLRLEAKLFAEVKDVLSSNIENLKKTAKSISLLDCLISFAVVAKENKYCRPTIVGSDGELRITDGRHPVVEAISRERFVPNDTAFDRENSTMIITGPNMAGKSTYMRQTALIVLMAQMGAFVPAKSAVIPVVDRIFTRVGATDNLILNQSTFMVEMTEVANILLHSTKDSLLILDEVGRGTSTYDGLSIAWAVVEYLTKNVGAKTLFATHYHELTELEGRLPGVKNYKVTVKEINGSIVFLRKIQKGGANKSFGVEVAALAGIPKSVTVRAKQILKSLEKNDINRETLADTPGEEVEEEFYVLSEVERIIRDTDVNTLSPMQALLLLSDLKGESRSKYRFMGKINILTANVFNRIAAGEVIEHPYSIVKELVENSIDAGATEIEVRIERGGKDYISVRDNGEGVDFSDLKSLFLPHATSKIKTADDLERIGTFGFRGEAVASIASVSHMSYTSKKKEAEAYKIECNGGEIGEAVQVAESETGTLAEVRDLFYNTKPRLGFFKSDRAEEGEITACVQRFILSNAHISFRLYADNKLIISSFAGGEEEVIASVYGASVLSNTFHICGKRNGIEVRGFISDRNFFKSNRSYQNIFLNGRYIVNSTITAAITNAYASYTMKRQYPFYVLHVRIPSEVVDVNVHPTKSDVRFADNQVVYSAIYGIISAVLDGNAKGESYLVGASGNADGSAEQPEAEKISVDLSEQSEKQESMPEPEPEVNSLRRPRYSLENIREEIRRAELEEWRRKRMETSEKQRKIFQTEYKDLFWEDNSMSVNDKGKKEDVFAENKRLLGEMDGKKGQTKIDVERCEYKGNLFNTFLLYELNDNVYIIDQHAAHERLIFNRLKEKMENRTIVKQNMLMPYHIRLTPSEDAFLFDCVPSLREMGFDIEEEETGGFVISAVPIDLQDISLDDFFAQFLRDINGFGKIKLEEILKDKLAMMACKAAIKGGMSLTKEEVMQLIADMNGDITLKCPHGRPVVVVMSKYEIEKMFKRIV